MIKKALFTVFTVICMSLNDSFCEKKIVCKCMLIISTQLIVTFIFQLVSFVILVWINSVHTNIVISSGRIGVFSIHQKSSLSKLYNYLFFEILSRKEFLFVEAQKFKMAVDWQDCKGFVLHLT
jgi:hypothetical protein